MLRVLHFSDVHVDVPVWRMPLGQMWNKRLVGGANLVFRRGRRFRNAREKLIALARFADEQAVDLVVCTGDYTALGTEPELVAARQAIDGLTARPRGFVTVPGNHDVYLHDAVADRRFERCFEGLLARGHADYAVDGRYPALFLYDEGLAVIAIDSARPNPQLWRSSGRIPDAQLAALRKCLGDPRLAGRTVLVATHYAPRRRDGSEDRWNHGLENANELLAACATHPRAAVLHGHIHWRFHVQAALGPHLFGAGSATDEGREGLWLYEVEAGVVRAVPGGYSGAGYRLEPEGAVRF